VEWGGPTLTGESNPHVRAILKADFQMVYYTQSSGVVHLEKLIRLVKQYSIALEFARQVQRSSL
jgi:hypothetical protein